MAQVPFLTNITLYRNVPLAPNYRDTVYFADHTEQQTWFAAFDSVSYTGQMYQRVGKNRVRLEGNPRQYEGVNYMKFQNYATGANNKWWFAFVLETEYINENVFEIEYEIDVMQSFLVGVEYELLDCYVEREHQATDTAGDNLMKEPIEIGDYVINRVSGTVQNPEYLQEPTNSLSPLTYVVAVMPILDNNIDGGVIIVTQPSDQFDKTVGGSASFHISAKDSDGSYAGINYRWWIRAPLVNPDPTAPYTAPEWEPIMETEDNRCVNFDYTDTNGSNQGCTMTISNLYAGDTGTLFRCVVTDQYGYTVTSKQVGLTVDSFGGGS